MGGVFLFTHLWKTRDLFKPNIPPNLGGCNLLASSHSPPGWYLEEKKIFLLVVKLESFLVQIHIIIKKCKIFGPRGGEKNNPFGGTLFLHSLIFVFGDVYSLRVQNSKSNYPALASSQRTWTAHLMLWPKASECPHHTGVWGREETLGPASFLFTTDVFMNASMNIFFFSFILIPGSFITC